MTQYRKDPWEEAIRQMQASIRMPQSDIGLRQWLEEHESFKPHWGQMKVVEAVENGAREIDIIAAPRSGKTEICRKIAKWMVLTKSMRWWMLGPSWDVVDRMYLPMWEEFEKEAMAQGTIITGKDKESRMIRTAGGGFLEGVSWVAMQQLEAQGIDGAITDESQYLTPAIASKIRDRLEGNYLWIRLGRPAETGASFYEQQALEYANMQRPGHVGPITWPRWANPDQKTRVSVQIELGLLKNLKKTRGKDSPEYKQEYKHFLVSFAGVSVPPSDIALSSFDGQIHVQDCPYDPDLPVYLAIDPGYYPSFYAVAVFQPHPKGTMLKIESGKSLREEELWQIDEIYVQQTITDDVITMCKTRPWWGNVKKAIIDVAARQSNRQTGTSDIAVWQKRTTFPVLADFVGIDDGLNVHRRWLTTNRLFHDRQKCPSTIREYSLYKMRVRRAGDVKDIPIDANNHIMKCIAYLLVNQYGVVDGNITPVSWTRQTRRPVRRRYA